MIINLTFYNSFFYSLNCFNFIYTIENTINLIRQNINEKFSERKEVKACENLMLELHFKTKICLIYSTFSN